MKPGDKVKFLNSSGGGVVARVLDNRMVSVMVEEGFEIPTLVSELIVVGANEPAARFFDEPFRGELPQDPVPEPPSDDRMSGLPVQSPGNRKTEEVSLAFVPQDQKWLLSGPVDVFLVNHSPYDILYNLFLRTRGGRYEGQDYGNLFPDSKILLSTVNREQLLHWTDGAIQFLFHRESADNLLPPFNSEFSIDEGRFLKEGNYREHYLLRSRAMVIRIVSLAEHLAPRGDTTQETT